MKKLSRKRRDFLVRQAQRRLGFRGKRAQKPALAPLILIRVVFPKIFSLRDNFDESMKCINEIRNVVLVQRQRVFIDLSQVTYIGVSCALAMSAEIYRCKFLRPGRGQRIINGNYPMNDEVYHRLYHMNFFRLFGIVEPYDYEDDKDVSGNYTMMMQSFVQVDAERIAAFRDVCVSAFGKLDEKARKRMQGAISEALLNCFNHAFTEQGDFAVHGRHAWLAGYVNPDRQEMAVMVLDQGAGIPRTLTSSFLEVALTLFPGIDLTGDGAKIRAATQLGRTSTGTQGRGKGFRSMKAFVDACEDAELQVFSNAGHYNYSGENDEAHEELQESLGGTLVLLRARHTGEVFAMEELDG